MPDGMVVFACVRQCIAPSTLCQLGQVMEAMLAISGRVTMRGLSRWESGIGPVFPACIPARRHAPHSYPVVTDQVDIPLETSGQAPPKQTFGGARGRPTGSKNRNRREVELSPSLCCIQHHIKLPVRLFRRAVPTFHHRSATRSCFAS
jgi:hypothetical protein